MSTTVQPTPSHAPTAKQSPADEMADRAIAASLDKVVAAIPEAVQQAAQKTGLCTPEQAAEITAGIIARLTGAACPVYRDCSVTEPGHYDHSGHSLKAIDDTDGSTVLDAGMVALSGRDRHAIVYVRNAEFTDAASVRAKTAELRRFLDEVDAMADRVFADHEGRA